MKPAVWASIRSPLWLLLILGLLLYLATGAWNIGIIAMDDYFDVVAHIVPAQSHNIDGILADRGFRSPIPKLLLLGISKLALYAGIETPATQYRIVLTFWAGLSFLLLAGFGLGIVKFLRDHRASKLYVLFLSFYFVCPLMLTRSMIESLSTPFLLGSLFFATRYYQLGSRSTDLFSALTLLVLASILRFQVGCCLLALLGLVLWKRQWRQFLGLIFGSGLAFVMTGFLDQWLRGEFHFTLHSYLQYNIAHSSKHGVTPFYTFLLLFLGLSLPPTFLSRFKGLRWTQYRALIPTCIYFLVFLVSHSMIPHKEERFMIPVLPMFLILLIPLTLHLVFEMHAKWRLIYFGFANFILLVLTTINIPQNNIIGLATYLQQATNVKKLVSIDDSVVLFPTAFVSRPVETSMVSASHTLSKLSKDCGTLIAIRTGYLDRAPELKQNWSCVGEFKPGLLENIVVTLNPKQNARRSAIQIYESNQCQG